MKHGCLMSLREREASVMNAFSKLRRVRQVDIGSSFQTSSEKLGHNAKNRGEKERRLMPNPVKGMNILVQKRARNVDFGEVSACRTGKSV